MGDYVADPTNCNHYNVCLDDGIVSSSPVTCPLATPCQLCVLMTQQYTPALSVYYTLAALTASEFLCQILKIALLTMLCLPPGDISGSFSCPPEVPYFDGAIESYVGNEDVCCRSGQASFL